MNNFKRALSLLLAIVMVVSMLTVIATAHTFAAQTDTAQTGAVTSSDSFSWDNATVYFLMTDRFYNGDTSNDHAYGRATDANGNALSGWDSAPGTFHGGDFAGITKKIKEGYFDDLGVNAIWLSAPYEQTHGYVDSGTGFAHYSYHGYYVQDYTESDKNFGTKEEFETLVDTAHEHGIRIILDVVMNHTGYNTVADMETYNFGTLKSGASDYKYRLTNVGDVNNYIDFTSSATDWGRWWGSDWIRSGLPGYTEGNGELQMSLQGLPDFKTESTNSVTIPPVLKTKWTQEGTYNQKISKYGSSNTVSGYIVDWLSEWVEEYGVDGFRCDTAKHVELASWKKLKEACVSALDTWRKNNPSKPGADWDDDFWMTGECWGHGLGYSEYYSQGGFDSMINFSFSGVGVSDSGSINGVYSNYASEINNREGFNALTYISSHDTNLYRGDLIYQGSAFLLMPGAVQIFYGDETNRNFVSGLSFDGNGGSGHSLRSDMNWNSIDQTVLDHWQKVGTFRNNHIAVGAGSHNSISSTSGTAFVREYNKNGVTDTVFACIAATSNTNVTLTVGSYVEDGTLLYNAYDGSSEAVSGGQITFNSGSNGTILLEVAGSSTKPDVSVSKTGGKFADTLTITAKLNDFATLGTYQIGSASAVKFTGSTSITIGEDMDFDESVTIKFTATDGTDTKERSYTYTKIDPSAIPFKFPTARTTYLVDTANWGKANCYAWLSESSNNAAWPGLSMTECGEYEGYTVYSYEVPETMNNVIFNNGSGTQTADLTFQQYCYFDNGTNRWVAVDYVVIDPTQSVDTVDIILGDADGDGTVAIIDATDIQRYSAKQIELEGNCFTAADVDGDGNVTILDATEIQRYIAYVPVNYPIGESITVETPTEAETEKETVAETDNTYTVYVDMGSQTNAYAYYWSKSTNSSELSWPGVPMEYVSGNIYSVEVDKKYDMIIFSNNGSNQTGDLTIPGDGALYSMSQGSWVTYTG